MAGLYVHIPFCKSRCIYCGFYSTTLVPARDEYIDAVVAELSLREHYLEDAVSTVYLGGGTPSQLTPHQLERLMTAIYNKVGNPAEVTIECNPDDIDAELARLLPRLGVNRVSMGAQTFSDMRLRFLRRRHNARQIITAVDHLRNAGIENISIDLIYGFPRQTPDQWADDLKAAVSLSVEHLSAYCLMIEEGTPLFTMKEQGELDEPDEEQCRDMFFQLCEFMEQAGYEHYEISNFARPGFRSRHNSGYWNQTPYLGLGAAAHSYDRRSRQWNVADVGQYVESIGQGAVPCEREELSAETRYNDLITTALRTREGISTTEVKQTHGPKLADHMMRNARRNLEAGLLQLRGGRLSLTREGIFVSDDVMSDLIWV